MSKFKVTIDTQGNFKIEGQKFLDGSCLAKSQPIEALLGVVTDRTYKPEASIPTQEQTTVEQQQHYSM